MLNIIDRIETRLQQQLSLDDPVCEIALDDGDLAEFDRVAGQHPVLSEFMRPAPDQREYKAVPVHKSKIATSYVRTIGAGRNFGRPQRITLPFRDGEPGMLSMGPLPAHPL